MSKQSYLLTILFICVIGFVIAGQLRVATQSADRLLADEVIRKIDIQIKKVYQKLKRFPDSRAEFETMVLGHLDWHLYKRKIFVHKFVPGSQVAPAFFQVKIAGTTSTTPVKLWLAYYGCNYHANLKLKGKLIDQ